MNGPPFYSDEAKTYYLHLKFHPAIIGIVLKHIDDAINRGHCLGLLFKCCECVALSQLAKSSYDIFIEYFP